MPRTRPVIVALSAACLLTLVACYPSETTEESGGGKTLVSPPAENTSPDAFSRAELIARGELIAGSLCSTCHSVDRAGDSPHADAIPFRQLSWNYPVEALAEPLAEGIVVGHPDMPEWQFDPYDIEALIAYIESIQQPRDT